MHLVKILKELEKFPSIIETLSGQETFIFVTVAADFVHRNKNSIYLDKYIAPHHYLNLALPAPSMPGTWEVLWTVLFTILEESHIDPASLICQHGLSQDNDKKYSKDL
ncbi:hypothetical protein CROQUDRAFT_661621 [Cronartium quercuum f. sp. fusiforme G11]|uniref:Uncharacterized protein n=1 Tax=Cronartium quercuum f. sp. fusiforme G11 TaxID=708437 RepID=A0A9P6NC59_9BASI|nr:hypothetical protein CROQUDRAFT_661621 [Cronartium quercuum f. sp. fusiforme G11]